MYHAYPGAGYEQGPAVIGLAWSKNLRDWSLDVPCLRASDGAEWECGGLYKRAWWRTGHLLSLLQRQDAPRKWREQTGVAVSRDLKSWKRYEGNPILRNGEAGSADERFASDPCVVKDGAKWAFFYFGLDAKGVARDLLAMGPIPTTPRSAARC